MTLKNKKILVTGAAGFIGSNIVDALVNKGAEVTAVDNLHSGDKKNLDQSKEKICFKNFDIRCSNIAKIIKKPDIIFHFAANADVPYSVTHPDYDFQTNVIGTYNLLQFALKSSVEKFIFASSAAVYGKIKNKLIDEKYPLTPISPYGASKLSAEKLGMAYYETYKLPFTVLRIFNTYGPRQSKYVMYDLIKKILRNQDKLEVLGTGEQIRDYLYIEDMVQATLKIACNPRTIGEVFNISGGKPVKIKKLVQIIINKLNLQDKTKIYYTGESWPGDIQILSADISKIKKFINWHPTTPLTTGLTELISWLQRN